MPRVTYAAPKELRDQAKELGVEFDKDTTEAELKILVDSAEAAAKAREEQGEKKEGTSPAVESIVNVDAKDQGEPEVHDTDGDTVIGSHKGFSLVETAVNKKNPNPQYFLKNEAGQVIGQFDSREEGLKHIENLSRF